MNTHLDHIVIGAATLDEGVRYVKRKLGVDIPPGGEHPQMGTHNHVMRLGDDVYLEVVAVNPAAAAPDRPRWFGLDDPFVCACLRHQPRLLTWVVNTADVAQLVQKSSYPFGPIEALSRGRLEWLITIPEDGGLPASGLLPTLIQWRVDSHPARRMANLGCELRGLEIYHAQMDWLGSILAEIGASPHIDLHALKKNTPPCLVAHIETPSGLKTLSSRPHI